MATVSKARKANVLESIGIGVGPGAKAKGEAEARKLGKKILANADAESDRWAGLEGLTDRVTKRIPLGRIAADPGQPRADFDPGGIAELAASIRTVGQLVPVDVWWDAGVKKYRIISGERRYRAAPIAGKKDLICTVHNDKPDHDTLRVMQLVENLQRRDLGPIEDARAFQTALLVTGWAQAELARRLGCTEGRVSKSLSLVRKLPVEVQDLVATGKLAASHAYELTRLDSPEKKSQLAARAVQFQWSQASMVNEVNNDLGRAEREARWKKEQDEAEAERKLDRANAAALTREAKAEGRSRPDDDEDDEEGPPTLSGGKVPSIVSGAKPAVDIFGGGRRAPAKPPRPKGVAGWERIGPLGSSEDEYLFTLPDGWQDKEAWVTYGVSVMIAPGSNLDRVVEAVELALVSARIARGFSLVPGGSVPGDRVTLNDPANALYHGRKGELLEREPAGPDFLWVKWDATAAAAEETRAHPAAKLVHLDPLLVEMVDDLPDAELRVCRVCGCTDDRACEGGCSWVEADLCSACVVTKPDGTKVVDKKGQIKIKVDLPRRRAPRTGDRLVDDGQGGPARAGTDAGLGNLTSGRHDADG
jgi:ParB family chromosome partitioning protein